MRKQEVKFETLHKRLSLKSILIGVLVVVVISLVVINRVSHASFTSSLNVPLSKGKINYKHPDFKVMAMFVQASSGSSTYNETDSMPSGEDYEINRDKSYCYKGFTEEKDTGVVLKTVVGNHIMNNLTKNDRCFLYFDEANNVASILAKYPVDDSRSGEITGPFEESTPNTVYSRNDNDGTSYMFTGPEANNWVKLGNLYFRIVRFNGNGSMRLIYSGDGAPATTGAETVVGSNVFNEKYDDEAYVGLKYTVGEDHGNSTNSTVLGKEDSTDVNTLYGWYNNQIKPNYENLIDLDAGFCSDRKKINTNEEATYRASLISTYDDDGYIYSKLDLTCPTSGDNLKLPVGLITADEYALAGGMEYGNVINETWLYNGGLYWTMSPYFFLENVAYVALADSFAGGGYVSGPGTFVLTRFSSVASPRDIRPVINLKSVTTFEKNNADGSIEKPYVVQL